MDDDDDHDGVMMQGWLYLIRSNTLGFKYSRKLYYVLQNCRFKSFRSISHSYDKDPVRSAVVDSSIHVIDNGRKCIRGKVFFVFTICDTSNYDTHLKLGASSPAEAAGWIKSFQEISQKINWRLNYSGKDCDKIDDDIVSLASIMDRITADINEPSYWTIFGCHNGLRLFKQARDQVHNKKDSHPALAAVCVIEETPDVIFQTLMSLGSSRSQWDFCFHKGSVIESIDRHTDIIHKQLNRDWLPWSMKQRDFVLQRYWRRDENGAYVILYQSVTHKKCPPQRKFTRARIKCGGYVISPLNQHKQSIVRHWLAIDWKSWRPYLQKSSAPSLTIRMLERLAALRELFKTNVAECLMPPPDHINLINTDDESDEFFDLSDALFDDESDDNWDVDSSDKKHEFVCGLTLDSRTIYAAAAAQKTGCAEFKKIMWDECVSYNYTITLPEDQTGNMAHSWSTPEPSIFQIRGETFLEDHKKITAESTLLQTVAMDWLKSDKREDHLAIRPGNIVQKYAADGRPEFFIIVNFQIAGSTTYNLASYYMTRNPIKDMPLLERFIEGDDAFRNSRFKIIPHVTKGPWILRQTIHRPTLIGQKLKINYIRGNNYLEMDIDVGSSATARVVAGKTFSCFSSLIIDTAFVIQANTQDELPEQLLGAFRISHLDISKAVWANQPII